MLFFTNSFLKKKLIRIRKVFKHLFPSRLNLCRIRAKILFNYIKINIHEQQKFSSELKSKKWSFISLNFDFDWWNDLSKHKPSLGKKIARILKEYGFVFINMYISRRIEKCCEDWIYALFEFNVTCSRVSPAKSTI